MKRTVEYPEGVPLSIVEARLVAQQIRESTITDRQYWPWVIEELCRMLEAARTTDDKGR